MCFAVVQVLGDFTHILQGYVPNNCAFVTLRVPLKQPRMMFKYRTLPNPLTIWRLLHMLRHFDPPFSGRNLYSFDSYILAKMEKMSNFDLYFSSKLGKMYSFDPPPPLFFFLPLYHFESAVGAEHPYPKPDRVPPEPNQDHNNQDHNETKPSQSKIKSMCSLYRNYGILADSYQKQMVSARQETGHNLIIRFIDRLLHSPSPVTVGQAGVYMWGVATTGYIINYSKYRLDN